MGYDMRIEQTTEDEREAVRQAHERFMAAVQERDALPPEHRRAHEAELLRRMRERREAASRADVAGQEVKTTKGELPPGSPERGEAAPEEQERDAPAPVDREVYQAAQAKVEAAYEEMQEADLGYFRLNIFGMGRYRELMYQLGMLVTDYELGDFPEIPEGVTWEEIDAAQAAKGGDKGNGDAAPVNKKAADFAEAHEAHIRWHPEPVFGIAAHKFGSNDGWLVTPEEISAALESYRTHSAGEVKALLEEDDDALDYWLQWIGYLEHAQLRGGFRVW